MQERATQHQGAAVKKLLLALFVSIAVVFGQGAHAATHATPDEAKAMAMKAADFLKQNGPEKAFAAFDAPGGAFHDRDLYVFVQNDAGVVQAHGTNPALIGKNLLGIKDVDGKPFVQQIVGIKDNGWVDYKWQDPTTKLVEPKTSYIVRVGNYLVGVGAYKN
jgi:cytochrome c